MANSNSLSNQQALALKVLLLLAALLAVKVVYYRSSWESYKSLPHSPLKDLLLILGIPLIVFLCNIPRSDPLEIGPFRIRICLRNLPRVLQVVWKTEEHIPSYALPRKSPFYPRKTCSNQQATGQSLNYLLPTVQQSPKRTPNRMWHRLYWKILPKTNSNHCDVQLLYTCACVADSQDIILISALIPLDQIMKTGVKPFMTG
jgi:hypothetical protein